MYQKLHHPITSPPLRFPLPPPKHCPSTQYPHVPSPATPTALHPRGIYGTIPQAMKATKPTLAPHLQHTLVAPQPRASAQSSCPTSMCTEIKMWLSPSSWRAHSPRAASSSAPLPQSPQKSRRSDLRSPPPPRFPPGKDKRRFCSTR